MKQIAIRRKRDGFYLNPHLLFCSPDDPLARLYLFSHEESALRVLRDIGKTEATAELIHLEITLPAFNLNEKGHSDD